MVNAVFFFNFLSFFFIFIVFHGRYSIWRRQHEWKQGVYVIYLKAYIFEGWTIAIATQMKKENNQQKD